MVLFKDITVLQLCLFAFFCNFIIATHATILRLPCKTFAEFDKFEVNKALKGSLIRKDQGLGDAECMMKCVEHERCRSYNFNWEQKECELNEKRFGDANTQLMDAAGWVYKSTNYDNLLVGSTCKSLAPCPPDVLCRDTCTSPFYECVYCDKNHKGLHCDILIDQNYCEKNPCQNGTCVDTEADYRCTCNPGYTGKNCETDINECENSPCSNGGTCENRIASFKCTCAPGYSGNTCKLHIDECASSPCLNGATCQDQIASFKCTCAHGYTGIKCESDIDECASSPCSNGGTCQDQIASFKCTCASGYSGAECEIVLPSLINVVSCEGTNLQISCTNGRTLTIMTAFYGRKDRVTCLHSAMGNIQCSANSAFNIVKDLCNGKASCSIPVNNGQFGGDPCGGTFKYLDISK